MSSPEAPSAGPSTPPGYSSGPSTPPSYSSGPSTPPNYSSRSSRNAECSNCKHLRGKITVLKATMNMHMHLKQHTFNLAALLHEEIENPNITKEEYIQLMPDKVRRHGRTFNLKIATYDNENYDDFNLFTYFKTVFPTIVYNDE
nr:hypothetical protein [Tanacetum cinerariifolium]